MNIEELREYCLSRPGATESLPFGPDTLVYKAAARNGKMKVFAIAPLDRPDYIMVKCNPDLAVELRERYPYDIEPAHHCNKKHWNGVKVTGVLTSEQIKQMIDHSYDLIVRS